MRALILLCFLAPPLWGQATPSIQQGVGDRRDVVSLREYMDVRFTALEAKLDARDRDRQVAIDKAEESVNKRLEGVPGTFVTKPEFVARADGVDRRLATIENRIAGFDGKTSVLFGVFIFIQLVFGITLAWWLSRKNGRPRQP